MSADVDQLLQKFRKKPIADPAALAGSLDVGVEGIEKIIPHREPFRLIDRLTGLDLDTCTMMGTRTISPDEPVFHGHFPGYPVYPGVLTIETIGQLSLCLHYFVTNNTRVVAPDAKPVGIRFTKLLGALFLEPVLPGRQLVLIAQKLGEEGYAVRIVGQALSEGKVCCVMAAEGLVLE